jgi:hypothetical protein
VIAPGNVELLSEAEEINYGDEGNKELRWMNELGRTWRHVIRDTF